MEGAGGPVCRGRRPELVVSRRDHASRGRDVHHEERQPEPPSIARSAREWRHTTDLLRTVGGVRPRVAHQLAAQLTRAAGSIAEASASTGTYSARNHSKVLWWGYAPES